MEIESGYRNLSQRLDQAADDLKREQEVSARKLDGFKSRVLDAIRLTHLDWLPLEKHELLAEAIQKALELEWELRALYRVRWHRGHNDPEYYPVVEVPDVYQNSNVNLVELKPAQIRSRWDEVRRAYPGLPSQPPTDMLTWANNQP